VLAVTLIQLLSLLAILAVAALAGWLVDKIVVVVPEARVAAWGILVRETTTREEDQLRDDLWDALEPLGYPMVNRESYRDHPGDRPQPYVILKSEGLEMFVGVHFAGDDDCYVSWNVVLPQRTYYVWQLRDLGLNELNRTRAFAAVGLEAVQRVVLAFVEKRQLAVDPAALTPSGTLGALHHAG
jgi:hypothetical protein